MLRRINSIAPTSSTSTTTTGRRVAATTTASLTSQVCFYSVASMRGHEVPWQSIWSYERPTQPDGSWNHPHPQLRYSTRKSVLEWRLYHGHGQRIGHMGAPRELPDWEHADGTPGPHSTSRYAYMIHKHQLISQIIRSAAKVEQAISDGRLPKIPSTAVQRDWDPEIPLFLDDGESDERGAGGLAAEWFVAPKKLQPATFRNAKFARKLPDDPINAGGLYPPGHPRAEQELASSKYAEPISGPLHSDYDEPSSFINESVPMADKKRPWWNRRLWALTDELLIQKPGRNKNTIGSD